ncbi:hypothetical protein [Bradyrhizobium sp. HKCCYLR20261]|uniref:hypothetical protein n=1 Tax=unclassified Bradyrhizobium TaxID=2631580 RepID=UPI003EB7881B
MAQSGQFQHVRRRAAEACSSRHRRFAGWETRENFERRFAATIDQDGDDEKKKFHHHVHCANLPLRNGKGRFANTVSGISTSMVIRDDDARFRAYSTVDRNEKFKR